MFKNIFVLTVAMLIYGCNSNDEALTALDDAELTELHELKPITGDEITREEYEAALDLVDNESEDSNFRYSTDGSEIAMLQKRNAESNSQSGEAIDKMIADFGGFDKYAEFVENPDHSAEYLKEIHNNYGTEYIDATENKPHDSAKDNTGELGPMVHRPEFIGLSMREASGIALSQHYKNIQIIKADNEYLPVSSECEPGKLNLWLSDSVVIDAKEDDC